MSRPRKPVDQEQVAKLMSIQCTEDEICGFFGIHSDTLLRRIKEWGYTGFTDMYKKHSQDGKISLRRSQFKVANGDEKNKPNVTMLIWLGKQYLGQKELPQFANFTPTDDPQTLKLVDDDKSKTG